MTTGNGRGRKRWRPILTGAVVIALLGGLVGASLIPYSRLVRSLVNQQMTTDATLVAELLDQQIHTLDGVITSVTASAETTQALLSTDPRSRREAVQRVLVALTDAYPDIQYQAAITDSRGAILGTTGQTPLDHNLSNRIWFRGAVSQSAPYVSPVFQSATGSYVVTTSLALRASGQAQGRLLGVLAVGVEMSNFQALAQSHSRGHADITILDRTGSAIASGSGGIPAETPANQRAAAGRRALAGSPDLITGRATSADGDWSVVSSEPISVAMRPVYFYRLTAIAGLAAALIMLLFISMSRNRYRRARDEAEAQAADGARLLAALVESSPDVMLRVRADGLILTASRASTDVLGAEPEELAGQSILDLLINENGHGVRAELDHLLATGERVSFVASNPRRSGQVLDCGFSLVPAGASAGTVAREVAPDEVTLLGTLRDVTARVSDRDRVEQLFTLSQDFMAVMDFDGRLVQVNPVWTAELGLPRELVVGHTFTEVFAAGSGDGGFAPARFTDGSMQVASFETQYRAPGQDEPRVLLWTVAPDARFELVYAVGRDITSHKELERALADARDQAVEASRLKSEFVATMSHEIRTPMNGVIGLTDLLALTPLDETQLRYVDGVRTAGDALLSVINDILDFSKIEADRLVLDHVDFRLQDVTGDVITLVRSSAEAKHLDLSISYADDLPVALNGDPGRVRQILLNLAHNAVKFTAQGSVRLHVHRGPPRGEGRLSIVFDVIDTGIGIEPGTIEELFEPFRQADEGVTRAYGGTGLGLSISLRLAELMGGAISVVSTPGQGTTFTAELLFTAADDWLPAVRGSDARGLSVLVVDDNEVNRLVMETQLTSWGMRPVVAESSSAAMELLLSPDGSVPGFDLAVIDMHMPDGSGLDLARAIRAVPGLSTLPLILLTSDQGVDAEVAAAHTITATLTKPVQQSALFDALSRVPVAPVAPVEAGPARRPRPLEVSAASILLVEDNEINQTVALGILKQLGYGADVAPDGQVALDLCAAKDYDVILMDCQMPRLDGYAATTQLRTREEVARAAGQDPRRTPVIAMTAATFAADRQRCFDSGMDDFIGKPVRVATLKAALTRWLAHDPSAVPPASPDSGSHPEESPMSTPFGETPETPEIAETARPAGIPAPRSADTVGDEMGERVAELLGDGSDLEIELVHDIVTSFRTRAVELLTQLADALTSGDVEAIHLHAHTLVGAGLNLGAQDVANAARQIEADVKTGNIEACLANLPVLMAAVDVARSRLAELLDALPPVSATS